MRIKCVENAGIIFLYNLQVEEQRRQEKKTRKKNPSASVHKKLH